MAPEAVAMPRATCPFFLPPLWLSQSPERSVILLFKPQDPRPTSLGKLPTEFATLNSPIRNPVARQLLFEPLSFFVACSSSAQLLALPATATGSAVRSPAAAAWECRRTPRQPRTQARRSESPYITTTTTGRSSGGFCRVYKCHQRYQQCAVCVLQ